MERRRQLRGCSGFKTYRLGLTGSGGVDPHGSPYITPMSRSFTQYGPSNVFYYGMTPFHGMSMSLARGLLSLFQAVASKNRRCDIFTPKPSKPQPQLPSE